MYILYKIRFCIYIWQLFYHLYHEDNICHFLGPVVQSIVSLMRSLVVKMLTVLVSTISDSQVFLLNKY